MKDLDEETGRAAEGLFVAIVLGAAIWMIAYLIWSWVR
jgi:hypothetical protein